MMAKSTSPIANVSDTAIWVAMYRAMESERPDAHFRDPYASQLAGDRGRDMVARIPKGKQFAWPMIVRTTVIDEMVMRLVGTEKTDVVVNLAAGLDTRPFRLKLPKSLRWIDADLPDILDYKEAQLAGESANCAYEVVRVDLTDLDARRQLLERAGAVGKKALVISEGLLVYLTPEQVADLARDLASVASMRWWLTDIAAPRLLKMLERNWGKTLQAAPFRFAPADGTEFFRPHGWEEVEYRQMFDESIRLKRSMPLARFWRFLMRFYPRKLREELERMSGVVLLRRSPMS